VRLLKAKTSIEKKKGKQKQKYQTQRREYGSVRKVMRIEFKQKTKNFHLPCFYGIILPKDFPLFLFECLLIFLNIQIASAAHSLFFSFFFFFF
jgi:hypothetical protein